MINRSISSFIVPLKLISLVGVALVLASTAVAQERAGTDFRAPARNRILLYVDDSPVSEAQFNAKRAVIAEQQKTFIHQVEPSQDDLDATALSLVIEEQILLDAAKAQGIEYSDAEVTQRVRSMQDEVGASDNEDAKAGFRWAITQHGLTDAEFASDMRIISAYRRVFTLGEIRSRIVASRGNDLENNPATTQSPIEQFVQDRRAKLRVADPSISTAARTVQDRLHLE